jgi:capsular exopolysaccharide synthesis family protein
MDVLVPPQFADTAKVKLQFNVKVNDKGLARVKVFDHHKDKIADLKNRKLPCEVKTIYGTFVITATEYYPKGESCKMILKAQSFDAAAEDLDEDISAEIANKKTHVIRLSYPTDNTDFGKLLLNTVMRKYDERVIANKTQQSNKTLGFLDKRIAELSSALAGVESGLQQFKESNNLVDLEADAQYNLTMKGELAKQLLAAESQLEIARIARDFLATPGNEYSMIPFSSTDASATGVNALINTYNELVVKRLQLVSNAKEENYQVKTIEKQLDAMRGNIAVSLAKNFENNQMVVNELRSKMSTTQSSLGNIPMQERQLVDIKRDQKIKQELYLYLLEKREETAVMLSNAVSKGVVVDPSFVPSEPISMTKKKLLVIAVIVGLFLPIIFLYTRKLMRGKPELRAEIENQVYAPILGEISTSRAGKTLVVTPNSLSSTAELFKLIRTNLQFVLKDRNNKVVMVTSTQSGEGKSFISINTAAALALMGRKVLVVGLDIRKPMLAQYLNLANADKGLTSYLANRDIKFADICQKVAEVEGLDVVVAGIIPPNPSELLLDPRLQEFFREAREQYDYIIVDSAPVGMVSDSLSVAEFADATIYVTRIGVTRYRDIQFINTLYEEKRLPKMNVVVNGTKSTQTYGYGYGRGDNYQDRAETKGFFSKITRLFGKK